MADLSEYRRKRDPARTKEPIPATDPDPSEARSEGLGQGGIFVIQEHHATALHWDFRLEHEGVLASWAIPKGLPPDPKVNHLAVRTEDHPLEYATFAGDIAKGEYGGGRVSVWDHGRYELQKWSDREVKVVLAGERAQGRFVLIHTGGKQWLIHRMDAPARPDWQALPTFVEPMQPTPGRRPARAEDWAYEMNWAGERMIARIDGGRIRLSGPGGVDLSAHHPPLRALGASAGIQQLLLDGEIVRFDQGPPSGTYVIYDLLHRDGRSLLDEPYEQRRAQLDELGLAGPAWQTPPVFSDDAGPALTASRELGLSGIIAKRLRSPYRPGTTSPDWKSVRARRS